MSTSVDYKILSFNNQKDFSKWLSKNHNTESGLWIRFYKKGSNIQTMNYAEALDEALCYGWIDSLKKKYDEVSFIQKFTPRRAKSMWSKMNIEHIARLKKEGRMKEAGLKEVEKAKADGRWQEAYDKPSEMKVPEDFLTELSKDKKAQAFFDTLTKANTYAIAWRLQTAKKPETRERRFKKFLEMMRKGEKLH